MKRTPLIIWAIIVAFGVTGSGSDNLPIGSDQLSETGKIVNVVEPFWKTLERLPAEDALNAQIEFEHFGQPSPIISKKLDEIAAVWNSGQTDRALALCTGLPDDFDNSQVAVGINWMTPRQSPPESPTPLWYADIRIGTRDSINQVAFDIHRASNHLFVILSNKEGASNNWHVNISTNMGQTWSETYSWFAANTIPSVSAAVAANHCYVAYCYLGYARIRRFTYQNGQPSNFGDGSAFVDVFTVASPDSVKEVVLVSNQDTYNNRLYYLSITYANALRYLWDDVEAISWTEVPTGIYDAREGLDACYNYLYSSRFLFISFINTSNYLKIYSRQEALYLGDSESGQ